VGAAGHQQGPHERAQGDVGPLQLSLGVVARCRPWPTTRSFDTSGDSAWEKFYRRARTNATMVGIGLRLSTMEVHGLSALSNSVGEVGAKWMAKGAAQFAGPDRMAATKQFVYDRSPEMAHRMDELDRNVHEAIDEINRHREGLASQSAAGRVVDGARKFAYYGVAMLDMASATPTWMGAYLKGMAKAGVGGLGLSEDAAIDYANRAVRNAHGGGGTKDLAAVQRDKGVMSLATMFYSFWNHMYNRQRDLGRGWANLAGQVRDGSAPAGQNVRDFSRVLARSWYYFVVPQIVHVLLKPSADKHDDGSLEHFVGHLA
jgi:hypothetical protein